ATLKTAGTQALTATDAGTSSITGSEGSITVQRAAASTLTVAGFPSPITAGVTGTFSVTSLDAYGNIASGYRGTLQFGSSDSKASLAANRAVEAGGSGVPPFRDNIKNTSTQAFARTQAGPNPNTRRKRLKPR